MLCEQSAEALEGRIFSFMKCQPSTSEMFWHRCTTLIVLQGIYQEINSNFVVAADLSSIAAYSLLTF